MGNLAAPRRRHRADIRPIRLVTRWDGSPSRIIVRRRRLTLIVFAASLDGALRATLATVAPGVVRTFTLAPVTRWGTPCRSMGTAILAHLRAAVPSSPPHHRAADTILVHPVTRWGASERMKGSRARDRTSISKVGANYMHLLVSTCPTWHKLTSISKDRSNYTHLH